MKFHRLTFISLLGVFLYNVSFAQQQDITDPNVKYAIIGNNAYFEQGLPPELTIDTSSNPNPAGIHTLKFVYLVKLCL